VVAEGEATEEEVAEEEEVEEEAVEGDEVEVAAVLRSLPAIRILTAQHWLRYRKV